jgi:hypothetical protein
MKLFKSISCATMILSILGPNLANAYDSERFQQLSPDYQSVHAKMMDRIENLSEKTKINLSYKLYKVAFKGLKKLEALSDESFTANLNKTLEGNLPQVASEENSVGEEDLAIEDVQPLVPTENVAPLSEKTKQYIATSFTRTVLTSQVRTLVQSVGFSTDSSGKSSPLSKTAFSEHLLQMGSNQKTGPQRTIASSALTVFLKSVLSIVGCLAAIGLIILFPVVLYVFAIAAGAFLAVCIVVIIIKFASGGC